MAFERGKALIEQVTEAERIHTMLTELADDDYENEELEAREDEAYKVYWNALEQIAAYLMATIPGADKKTAWAMAKGKRTEMLTLFSRAK